MKYKTALLAIMIFCLSEQLFAQCACIGGAPVGSLSMIGGTTNVGILRDGNIRASSFYSYSNGDEYYSGTKAIDTGSVKNYKSQYLGFLIGYGLTDRFTVDWEIGSYVNKTQDFGEYALSGSGFSHTTIYGKYNIVASRAKKMEWTVGVGAKIPLNFVEQNLPQHIQSSTGAFGAAVLSYLHKGFDSEGLHFFLINRTDWNAENNTTYQYGTSFTNSLFITKSIVPSLVGMLELRSDIRLNDSKYQKVLTDTGWNLFVLSPQLNYAIRNFNFSIFYDIPVYKNYNGAQLTNKQTYGASLTWQANL
jgi:hypothetical protein